MLGVFQEVAIQIADSTIGELATFDLMYKGISSTLNAHAAWGFVHGSPD